MTAVRWKWQQSNAVLRRKVDASHWCDEWLSISSNVGLANVERLCSTKCSMNLTKSSFVIHPEPLACPTEPTEAFSMKMFRMFFRENRKNGGTKWPMALTANVMVSIVPRSCVAIMSTRRAPFAAKTFPIFVGTVEKPVSSMFQMDTPWNGVTAKTLSKLAKNDLTFSLQNAPARAMLVCSGDRKTKHGCRSIKAEYQLWSAFLSVSQLAGYFGLNYQREFESEGSQLIYAEAVILHFLM